MPVITSALSEDEQEVIEAAIEYVNQYQHGLYSMRDDARDCLIDAVEKLITEHDGRWAA